MYYTKKAMMAGRSFVWGCLWIATLVSVCLAQGNPAAGPIPERFFARPVPQPKAGIEAVYPEGRLLPISFFSADRQLLATMEEHGVTMMGPRYGEGVKTLLDDAAAQGVKAIYSVGFPKGQINVSDEVVRDEISKQVQAVVNHPALGWWYLTPEELRYWKPEELKYIETAVKAIRESDPQKRPIWMYQPNHYNAATLAKTAQYFDIIGKGLYTNYSKMTDQRIWVHWSMEQQAQAIAQANPQAMPLALCEMFQQPAAEDLPKIKAWVRHDVMLAMLDGAKALMVYSAARRKGFDARDSYLNAYLEIAQKMNGPEGWGRIFLFGDRKNDLRFDVTSGPAELKMQFLKEPQVSYPSIGHAEFAMDRERWVFLVNSAQESVELVVGGLPYGSNILVDDVEDPDAPFVAAEGEFTVSLKPLEARAYKIYQK